MMAFGHRSTRSSVALMSFLYVIYSTLDHSTLMHEKAVHTAPRDVREDSTAIIAVAVLLNHKGTEHGNDGTCPTLEGSETKQWLVLRQSRPFILGQQLNWSNDCRADCTCEELDSGQGNSFFVADFFGQYSEMGLWERTSRSPIWFL